MHLYPRRKDSVRESEVIIMKELGLDTQTAANTPTVRPQIEPTVLPLNYIDEVFFFNGRNLLLDTSRTILGKGTPPTGAEQGDLKGLAAARQRSSKSRPAKKHNKGKKLKVFRRRLVQEVYFNVARGQGWSRNPHAAKRCPLPGEFVVPLYWEKNAHRRPPQIWRVIALETGSRSIRLRMFSRRVGLKGFSEEESREAYAWFDENRARFWKSHRGRSRGHKLHSAKRINGITSALDFLASFAGLRVAAATDVRAQIAMERMLGPPETKVL